MIAAMSHYDLDETDVEHSTGVPVRVLVAYLKSHIREPLPVLRPIFVDGASIQPPRPVPQPEFLMQALGAAYWYVRWPNGDIKWESASSLRARGFTLPPKPLLTPDTTAPDAATLPPGPGIALVELSMPEQHRLFAEEPRGT